MPDVGPLQGRKGRELTDMNDFRASLAVLLPLLRCPLCHSCTTLQIESGPAKGEALIRSIQLCDTRLQCGNCNAEYPITADYIPIMWDEALRRTYTDADSSGPENPSGTSGSALDANLAIYDSISDSYNLWTRRNLQNATRIRNAVERILAVRREGSASSAAGNEQPRQIHLDFGCGPGHVLGWLKDFGFFQIGIDVSLRNLRSARAQTGCLVVCGNACNMPFADATMDIITESSVLHHILDWRGAITESIRTCKRVGGIVIDSEPSKEQMAWSSLAVAFFNARFPIYKALSYLRRDKYIFRDTTRAKLNLQAEVHHQPGTGFPVDQLEALFANAGFDADIILSPTAELASRSRPNWKSIILNVLSGRNPWNPRYGAFTAVATRKGMNAG